MLQIRIHRDDDITSGRLQTRLERRRLTEVAAQLDDAKARLFANEPTRYPQAVVAAAIINEDELKRMPIRKRS
jgi:hypothetical protein